MVRQNLLEAVVQSPPLLRSQLAECLKAIVDCDYPEQWPGLDAAVLELLNSREAPRLYCALLSLRVLARKYEYKDAEERRRLSQMMERAFPAMLRLSQSLLELNSLALDVADLLKLVLKTLWSSVYLEMPRHLVEGDSLSQAREKRCLLSAEPPAGCALADSSALAVAHASARPRLDALPT